MQPAVLIKFVLESMTTFEKKLTQLQAQARNACHVCYSQSLPRFLCVLIDPSSFKFEVHAFVGAEAASLADVMLVPGALVPFASMAFSSALSQAHSCIVQALLVTVTSAALAFIRVFAASSRSIITALM